MRTFIFLALCLWATPLFAQIYVGAAAGIDITLVSRFESDGPTHAGSGGTTPALAVRAGIGLGSRWGAEVEVTHAFTINHSDAGDDSVLASGVTSAPAVFSTVPFSEAVPPIGFAPILHVDSEEQWTAVNAVAWVSHPIGGRVDLALVAGAAFNRTGVQQRFRFEPVVLPGFPPRPILIDFEPQSARLISYRVGPLVGVEARIAFGPHLRVVPSFRMSSVGGGWWLHPTVGAAWEF